jgi:hypothetical protein
MRTSAYICVHVPRSDLERVARHGSSAAFDVGEGEIVTEAVADAHFERVMETSVPTAGTDESNGELMEAASDCPARTGVRVNWIDPFARTIDAEQHVVSPLDQVDWNAALAVRAERLLGSLECLFESCNSS